MFVPLPNLDDRRWADLVDEGRSLIPVLAPRWSDHNAHDPGITLIEMLGWITETDIYRVDQIPEGHIRTFLSLIGIRPLPPTPAHAVVEFELKKGAAAVTLPATTLLCSGEIKFQTLREISIQPANVVAVQLESAGQFRDLTVDWQRHKPLLLFGDNPQVNDSFYLGFDSELETGTSLSLYFTLDGEKAAPSERQRIVDELNSRRYPVCRALEGCNPAQPDSSTAPVVPSHHSLVLVWEIQKAPGVWEAIDAMDDTRSLSLSGAVTPKLSSGVDQNQIGAVNKPLAYVRVRIASGLPDAAPIALRVSANAVEASQQTPVEQRWTVAQGEVAVGTPPLPGEFGWFSFKCDDHEIRGLEFSHESDNALFARLLHYQPATNLASGSLVIEARRLGVGTGAPHQTFTLTGPQIIEDGFEVYAIEDGSLRKANRRDNLLNSGPADLDYVLDAGVARVTFGDGQRGRVPPDGAVIFAVASETFGAAGNVPAESISHIDASPNESAHNTALLRYPNKVDAQFAKISNPDAGFGGADAEPLSLTEGRVVRLVEGQLRAVTLADCEALALETPGATIARAMAIANHHPGFPCYAALGFITLVILPDLPLGRPMPSSGLLQAVQAYLNPRRVIGTRIEVTGPEYLEIAVKANVKLFFGENRDAASAAITKALRQFFDPLNGGTEGRGWPLGGDVYVSEVVEVIARVPGVDHVSKVELLVPGCGAQCGNVCLPPLALTVSGKHEISVS